MTNSLKSKYYCHNFLGIRNQFFSKTETITQYGHITSWTTGNLISEFCDLNLVRSGDFFTDSSMAIVSLRGQF